MLKWMLQFLYSDYCLLFDEMKIMLMYPYPYKWRFSSHSMREKSDAFFTIPISSPQLLRSCHIFSPLLSCFSLQCSPLLFVSQLIFLSSLSQSLLLPVATIVSPSLLFSSATAHRAVLGIEKTCCWIKYDRYVRSSKTYHYWIRSTLT